MTFILYLIILLIITYILFYLINNSLKPIENFCKITKQDARGDINNKNVNLTSFLPQSNIYTSSCDQYWKDWPLEANNDMVQDAPIVIKSDQLDLPKERMFGSNMYSSGLIDFKELALTLSDPLDYNIFDNSEQLYIDPITKKKLEYQFQFDFKILVLNRKTWINRWYNFNPSVKTEFNYEDIKSPVEEINILNKEFKYRLDTRQEKVLSKQNLILHGLIPFELFKYKILDIKEFKKDKNNNDKNNNNKQYNPIYVIQVAVFRENDLYLNTFSYVGFFENNKPIITEVAYIGRNSTDSVLLAGFNNPTDIKQEIINKNFSNSPILEKDPDAVAQLTKNHLESFKLKNQYACFDLNYEPNGNNTAMLMYFSREACESSVDPYGRPKSVGVYDTPCKKNEDCPFYKVNQNYENEFGKCLNTGYCELPSNMAAIGYKYFKDNRENKPLCYNCKSDKFRVFTDLDECCDEQYDKKKYPFLKTPDYAFNEDYTDRKNFFNKKYCHTKLNSPEIICSDIQLV